MDIIKYVTALEKQQAELERISNMTMEDARQILIDRVQKDAYHDAAVIVRDIEARAKEEAAEAKARAAEAAREARAHEAATHQAQSVATGILTSVLRSAGTQVGREITRSLFGTRRR